MCIVKFNECSNYFMFDDKTEKNIIETHYEKQVGISGPQKHRKNGRTLKLLVILFCKLIFLCQLILPTNWPFFTTIQIIQINEL